MPYLYRIVIEVFPTAALPHKTSLTAFFVLFFVKTFGCLSIGFGFDGPKHILDVNLISIKSYMYNKLLELFFLILSLFKYKRSDDIFLKF